MALGRMQIEAVPQGAGGPWAYIWYVDGVATKSEVGLNQSQMTTALAARLSEMPGTVKHLTVQANSE